VRLWTGDSWQPGTGPTRFTLVLKHPGAIRAMFWPFDRVSLGESYIFDDFDIEGDIFAFTEWLRHIVASETDRSEAAVAQGCGPARRTPCLEGRSADRGRSLKDATGSDFVHL
jgi:hypothetical protein